MTLPRRRRSGKISGFLYLKTPNDCRKAITRAANLMLVGRIDDPTYLRELAKYERSLAAYDAAMSAGRFDLEVPVRPIPPKIAPNELTALANAIRTWLECKTHDLEAKVDEMLATNQELFKLLEKTRGQTGGGQGPH